MLTQTVKKMQIYVSLRKVQDTAYKGKQKSGLRRTVMLKLPEQFPVSIYFLMAVVSSRNIDVTSIFIFLAN